MAGLWCAALPARAADELNLERLAPCRDSWLEWKADQARAARMGQSLLANYTQKQGEAYFVPKSAKTLLGMPVTRLYPDSIGMAVGFSVVVSGSFDATRKNLELAQGKALKQRESGEGVKSCQLELEPKKTIVLLSGDKAGSQSTLVGCAYYYEK
jgi:hypothetical protein